MTCCRSRSSTPSSMLKTTRLPRLKPSPGRRIFGSAPRSRSQSSGDAWLTLHSVSLIDVLVCHLIPQSWSVSLPLNNPRIKAALRALAVRILCFQHINEAQEHQDGNKEREASRHHSRGGEGCRRIGFHYLRSSEQLRLRQRRDAQAH